MVTMQFHIAQTCLFFRNIFFSHTGYPRERLGTNEKLSWGCKAGQNRSRVIEILEKIHAYVPLEKKSLQPVIVCQSGGSQDELIGWESFRRLCVSLWVCASVNTFKHEYPRNLQAEFNQILSEASSGWEKGCIRFLTRSD